MKMSKFIIVLLFPIMFCFWADSYAQKSKSAAKGQVTNKRIETQKKRIKDIEADINFLDKQIVLTNKKHSNTMQELVLLRKKIQNRNLIINELDATIKQQNDEIYLKTVNINNLQRSLDTLEMKHKSLIMNAYKNRDVRTWFMYIFASGSIEQGYRRWVYLKDFAKQINIQGNKVIEAKSKLIEERAKVQLLREENEKVLASRQEEKKKLANDEEKSKKYASTLSKKQADLKKELNKKRAESQRLNKEVQRLIEEAIRSAQKTSNKTTTSTNKKVSGGGKALDKIDEKLSAEFGENKGKLPWPVSQGVVIESFGEHNHPTLKNVKLPFNNGVNISTVAGAQVKSVFGGVVKQIIIIPGYNHCVLIQHGKYFTFYCKLKSVSVKAGDKINMGSILGSLEVKDDISVLHFELWSGTTKQNPEFWLKRR